MTNFAILHLLNIIEETDANRKRHEWQKRYNPALASPENIEAREIRRLGRALRIVVNPHNRLTTLRGY